MSEKSLTVRFEALISQYSREIYGYFLRATRDHHDAEELAQDVFVKAFRGMDALKQADAARSWLFSIAVRQLLDFLKSRQTRQRASNRQLDDGAMINSEAGTPDRAAQAREMRAFLTDEAMRLPGRQRTVMLMHMTGAMDYRDMATALEITPAAAKMSLFHGRETLRQRLSEFKSRRQE